MTKIKPVKSPSCKVSHVGKQIYSFKAGKSGGGGGRLAGVGEAGGGGEGGVLLCSLLLVN